MVALLNFVKNTVQRRIFKNLFCTICMALALASVFFVKPVLAVTIGSQSALVIDENSGKILLEKNADNVGPIASLTKLMTAMVVLDAKQDMDAPISIEQEDVDVLKHSSSRVPVGATLPRKEVLQLALMSSDNRAAAALARNYPGGIVAFGAAAQAKIKALGMTHTTIEEPTGLSPNNTSSASDLVKMAAAAATYSDITRITTDKTDLITMQGREVEYHNTNGFIGKKGWDVLLSKTGYTLEAGRCIIMKINAAGKNVIMVLLHAKGSLTRNRDATKVLNFLTGNVPNKVALLKPKRAKKGV